MARPTKQGIDFFPIDCNFDSKTQMLITKYGGNAISILLATWQLIYQDEGYFIKFDEDLFLHIKKITAYDVEQIEEILTAAIERNIFDKSIKNTHGILTSKAIQKRYFYAARRKKEVKIVSEYVIVGVENIDNLSLFRVSGDINGVSVNINGVNVVGNATEEKEKEKEKEKEEEKEKEKEKEKPREKTARLEKISLPKNLTEKTWLDFLGKLKSVNQKIGFKDCQSLLKKTAAVLEKGGDPGEFLSGYVKRRRAELVYISSNAYQSLVRKYGADNVVSAIEDLDGYMRAHGKKYKDHAAAVGNFIRSDIKKGKIVLNQGRT